MSAYGRMQDLAYDWEGPGAPCGPDESVEEWVIQTLFALKNYIYDRERASFHALVENVREA